MSTLISGQRGDQGRILLVEDNDDAREVLRDALELLGYSVEVAGDGNEALRLVQSGTADFDLVISDLVMPHANAYQLYQAVKQVQERVKMLIVTGYPMPYSGQTLAARPDVAWTAKPVRIEELSGLLDQLLAG